MSGRRFPLATVLYVTNGGMPGIVDGGDGLTQVQELLSFMTGSTIFLHQIPRAADVCQKYLRDQYGWLSKMQPTEAQAADVQKLKRWVRRCEKERGETLLVRVLPGGAYTYMDPIVEFTERMAASDGAGLAGSNA
ncbi:hypothetical protein ACFV6Y_38445 [Streptomyces massasporeus]|uniref:DUF7736 domain-containing protein n=1 Tax=Streptomyces massasporeus TaxID=67324 RepID=UPI003669D971